MKIFISWSGEPSQTFARALAEWLPMVIQSVKPFMSTNDIRSGQRWSNEIGKQLEENTFGIICLTPNNREAPWILFEAGALSKFVDGSGVVPLRIGIENAQITPALLQFQAKDVTKDDILTLVLDINSRMASNLDESVLRRIFEKFWPDLESSIKSALEAVKIAGVAPAKRSSDDMAEETLNTLRSLASNVEEMRMQLRILRLQEAQGGGQPLGALSGFGFGAIDSNTKIKNPDAVNALVKALMEAGTKPGAGQGLDTVGAKKKPDAK